MKRLFVAIAIMLATLVPAAPARAAFFEKEAHISFPNPAYGATENLEPCAESSDLQGFDGFWLKLPEGSAGRAAHLLDGDPEDDVDVLFYTGNCDYIEYEGMARGLVGEQENGVVPRDARWAIVSLFAGADAPFRFTVD